MCVCVCVFVRIHTTHSLNIQSQETVREQQNGMERVTVGERDRKKESETDREGSPRWSCVMWPLGSDLT